jgi:6-phosphogluconate dehydrogenase
MAGSSYEIGIVGLGTIGRNLSLNFAGQGYAVAGYDKDPLQVLSMKPEGTGLSTFFTDSLDKFISSLATPRTIMILVPSGAPTDKAIRELLPRLEPGDLLIDGGNSHFEDTNRRFDRLTKKKIAYLSVGISGGEQGARNGPSIMVGGDRSSYERVRPLFEAAAARVDGGPCVALLGSGSSGHYVKMIHNGIEYGIMQLIAESYGLLKLGLGLSADKLHFIYDNWNRQELQCYLLEMTARIFQHMDDKTGGTLIDLILDKVGQKGTAKWSSQDAINLEVPIPVIEVAISMRALSTAKNERESASSILAGPKHLFQGEKKTFIGQLRNALYACMIITFAQGMAQLGKASRVYGFNLALSDVARLWRGGCIIRAALLKEISISFQERPNLANLLLDPFLGQEVMARQADLRAVVRTAVDLGIPVPAFMAALSYYDSYRSDWLPVNLIQAQRDYFGAHTYQRIDEKGVFHTRWNLD